MASSSSPRVDVTQCELLLDQRRRTTTRCRTIVTPYSFSHSVFVWVALWGVVLSTAGVVGATAVDHDQDKSASPDIITKIRDAAMVSRLKFPVIQN